MGSLIETIQHKAQPKPKPTLSIIHHPSSSSSTTTNTTPTAPPLTGIRKRLSSLSLHIIPTTTTTTFTSFSFPRSQSLSALGHHAAGWWHRSWGWLTFQKTERGEFDLEQERGKQGSPSSERRSNWSGVWRKVRAGTRRIWGGGERGRLPVTTFRSWRSWYNGA
ncbi:hypothetical protein AKJ16_DCAP15640 [Drosera capensis]